MQEKLDEVVEILDNLQEDESLPKKVKDKLHTVISALKSEEEISLKINKCLDELDKISEDVNLQTFIRTQIWNAASLLEKVNQ